MSEHGTGKERILAALAGGQPDMMPVAIDYLGLYLAERTERAYVEEYRERLEREGRVRLDPAEDTAIRARAFLRAYEGFEERQDWLQVFGAPTQEVVSQRELVAEDGLVFECDPGAGTRREMLLGGEEAKAGELRSRFEEMTRRFERLRSAGARSPVGAEMVAEYERDFRTHHGNFGLVERLVRERGREQFIYMGVPSPFCSLYGLIGFEGMMTGLVEAPGLVLDMLEGLLESILKRVAAFRDSGGDGIRVEEYFASADIVSPEMYQRFAWPYEERLLSGIRRLGLKGVLYFCGDCMPRLPALQQLPLDGLMVEESKKDFNIDIGAVRAQVGPDLCLFGNIDSYALVQRGTEDQLREEVRRQIHEAGEEGAFVVGIGSPLPLDTPPQRADMLVRLTRAHPCCTLHVTG